MNNKVRIEVDESLKIVLEEVQRSVSKLFKKMYHINEIEIHGNVASRILAARYNHDKEIEYEVIKLKNSRGILKVI